jgi:UDP-N-acetyl-D-mannosaminuronate dehydrogenase
MNNVYDKLINKQTSLAVVGLGYVGMPIAVAFAQKGIEVIGFDNNEKKIELYKSGVDPTKEVGDDVIKNTTLRFTSDPFELKKTVSLYLTPTFGLHHTFKERL